MLILFDHGTPRGLARALAGHTVVTAKARGWDRLNNGALLKAAEAAAIDLLLTTDQRIRYQQNLSGRKIAIVVLAGTTKWSRVRLHLERIAAVVNAATPGSYTEVDISFEYAPRRVSQMVLFGTEVEGVFSYSAPPVFPGKLGAILENVTTGSRFDLTRVSGQPVSDAEILADLKSVASKLDATAVSQPHYRQYGRYDDTTVARHFGSWNKALLAAG